MGSYEDKYRTKYLTTNSLLEQYEKEYIDPDKAMVEGLYKTGVKKVDDREKMANKMDEISDSVLGEKLIEERAYSSDDKMVTQDNNTYLQQLDDGSFITRQKSESKLNSRDEQGNLDYNMWKNPLYKKEEDKNNLDNNSFTQAYINSKASNREMITEQIAKEVKAKQILLENEQDPERREIIKNDIDVLQATLFNPDAAQNYDNYITDNMKKADIVSAIEQSDDFQKIKDPSEKNFLINFFEKAKDSVFDPNKKDPFTYVLMVEKPDGSEELKVGYANDGGVFQRYKNQGIKFRVIGLHQGKDALEVEQKVHYLLKKNGIASNVDPSFGSGHTEVYQTDLFDKYHEEFGDKVAEADKSFQSAQMMTQYQKYQKGIHKYHDTMGFAWNLVKTGLAGVDSLLSGAAATILDSTVVNYTDRQNANSMLGQFSNMLHRRNEQSGYIWGIDTTTAQNASKGIHQAFADFNRGNIGSGFINIFKSFQAVPELIAGSLAYVGTAMKIAKVGKALGSSNDMLNTILGLTAIEANHDINMALKYNNGQDIGNEKKAAIIMGQFVNQAIQMGALNAVLKQGKFFAKSKDGEIIPLDKIKALDEQTYGRTITRAIYKPAGIVALGALEEGPAEFIDTVAHELLQKSGTEQYKNMSNEDLYKKVLPDAIEAGVFGAMMGSTMVSHRAIGEAMVPFSETMHSMFYTEEYQSDTLRRHIQSMTEEERNQLAENLKFSTEQIGTTYKEQESMIKSLQNGDVDSVVENLIKHYKVNISDIEGTSKNDLRKSEYMKHFSTKMLSQIMVDLTKSPELMNLTFNNATLTGNTLTNELSKNKELLAEIRKQIPNIDSNLANIVPNEIDDQQAIEHIIEYITKTEDSTKFNNIMKLITSVQENTQDERVKSSMRRVNASILSDIFGTTIKGNEALGKLKQYINGRIRVNLKDELDKSHKTIQILKTAEQYNIGAPKIKKTVSPKENAAKKQMYDGIAKNIQTNIQTKLTDKIYNKDKNISFNLFDKIKKLSEDTANKKIDIESDLHFENILKDIISQSMPKNVLTNKNFTQEFKKNLSNNLLSTGILADLTKEEKQLIEDSINEINNSEIQKIQDSLKITDDNKIESEPQEQYNKEKELTDLIDQYKSKKLPFGSEVNKIKELLPQLDTGTLERIYNERKDDIPSKIKREIAKELRNRERGKALLSSAMLDALGKSSVSIDFTKEKPNSIIAYIETSLYSGEPDVDELYKAINALEDKAKEEENDKKRKALEGKINELKSKIKNFEDSQVKENIKSQMKNENSAIRETIRFVDDFKKYFKNNDLDYKKLTEYINSNEVGSLDELLAQTGLEVELQNQIDELRKFIEKYNKDNEKVDILTQQMKDLNKRSLFAYISNTNNELSEEDRKTAEEICGI